MIKCLNVVRYGMVIKLSQIIILVYDLSIDPHPSSLAAKRTKTNPMSPRHRLKNPFTMSKRGACASYCRTCPANRFSSSLEYMVSNFCPALQRTKGSQGRTAVAA
jgi:hypothetical protein